MPCDKNFLAGVIEGFYGTPWSSTERLELFDWMARWGLNTYLYAPKDDLKHRALWRDLYSAKEAAALGQLCRACDQDKIRFIYSLSPGLDIRYHEDAELQRLHARFEQMFELGCRNFALLFDDIPDRLGKEDQKRWGSFAAAQCHVANATFRWARARSQETRFYFCPTPYCGRMARRELGGKDYLAIIGRELLPEIDIFWTGPEIISRNIPAGHVRQLHKILRRKPVIWDNLHANDYDGRRFYCGPYSGRRPELRHEVNGLLLNPNTEFPLNFVPLRTLAEFVHCETKWDSRKAYLTAMREWLPRFETADKLQPILFEDLVLFGDCYYLPHQEGPKAGAFYRRTSRLVAAKPADQGTQAAAFRREAARLREFCIRTTGLRDRALFHALSRRVWELREELDLLERFIDFRAGTNKRGAAFRSDVHLPGTYRGGMVPRLQTLLQQKVDGTFVSASKENRKKATKRT